MGKIRLIPGVLDDARILLLKSKLGEYLTKQTTPGEYAQTKNRDGTLYTAFKITLVLEDGMYVFQLDVTTTKWLDRDAKVNYQFTYWPNKQNPAIHKALPYDVYPGLTEEKFYDIAERYLKHVLVDTH